MRRSRRNGQLRRTCLDRARDRSRRRSDLLVASPTRARARGRTDRRRTTGPRSGTASSRPTRFTAATKTPFAIACARWIVCQASCCAASTAGALVELPADRRRVEEDLRARRARRAARPRGTTGPSTRASPMRASRAGDAREAEVAGREVELLVVERVVGDVHLAVEPGDAAVGVERHRGVVVEARGAPLEERRHDRDLARGRELAERLGRRARDRLGELEARARPRSGRSSGSGRAPAGRRCGRRARAASSMRASGLREVLRGVLARSCICTSPIDDRSRRACHAGVGTPRGPHGARVTAASQPRVTAPVTGAAAQDRATRGGDMRCGRLDRRLARGAREPARGRGLRGASASHGPGSSGATRRSPTYPTLADGMRLRARPAALALAGRRLQRAPRRRAARPRPRAVVDEPRREQLVVDSRARFDDAERRDLDRVRRAAGPSAPAEAPRPRASVFAPSADDWLLAKVRASETPGLPRRRDGGPRRRGPRAPPRRAGGLPAQLSRALPGLSERVQPASCRQRPACEAGEQVLDGEIGHARARRDARASDVRASATGSAREQRARGIERLAREDVERRRPRARPLASAAASAASSTMPPRAVLTRIAPGLQRRDRARGEQAARLRRERDVDADEVGFARAASRARGSRRPAPRAACATSRARACRSRARAAPAPGRSRRARSIPSVAPWTSRPSSSVGLPAVLEAPAPVAHEAVGLRDAACRGEQQREREIGGRLGENAGRVADGDAARAAPRRGRRDRRRPSSSRRRAGAARGEQRRVDAVGQQAEQPVGIASAGDAARPAAVRPGRPPRATSSQLLRERARARRPGARASRRPAAGRSCALA